MPANTSAASAICGTHFGLTNADTSITGRPGGAQAIDERDLVGGRDERRLVLQAVARADFVDRARFIGMPLRHSSSTSIVARLHELAFGAVDGADDAVARRADGQLHLHGLEHDERVAGLARGRRVAPHPHDGRGHRRRECVLIAGGRRDAAGRPVDLELEDVAVDADPDDVAELRPRRDGPGTVAARRSSRRPPRASFTVDDARASGERRPGRPSTVAVQSPRSDSETFVITTQIGPSVCQGSSAGGSSRVGVAGGRAPHGQQRRGGRCRRERSRQRAPRQAPRDGAR